ncbi:hypothetical protein V6B95_04885 [Thermoanaerobacterium saccharolyticum]
MRNEATLDEWKELYDVASKIKNKRVKAMGILIGYGYNNNIIA